MTNKFLSLGALVIRQCSRWYFPFNASAVVPINNIQIQTKLLFHSQVMGCRTSKNANSKTSKSGSQNNSLDDEYVEDVVCCESDIGENEMKVFEIKDAGKVLLVRQKGKIHALGTKCTHYGANLVSGALGDGRVRCQWHGACFNIETGDIEDFPGLDSLPCHQVTIENTKVKVRAKRSALDSAKRVKSMGKKLKTDNQHFVVIGGGPAGAICVETLRQENFSGAITLICKENYLPYDRVKISKVSDLDVKKTQFRTSDFYKENDISVVLGFAANKLNVEGKEVYLDNGQKINYDKLFIATGASAAFLNVPGNNLKNIITLRTFEDGQNFFSQLTSDTNVVIYGSSFIAMEAASACVDKVKSVTVIARSSITFARVLGEKIGNVFKELFKSKGIVFRTNTTIKAIQDDGTGKVGGIELNDDSTVEADILLLGLGTAFYTEFLKDSGIALRPDGSIEVDSFLRTNVTDIFAGGDIAMAPIYSRGNEKASIGHFALAHYHGKIAGLNMLQKNQELRAIPYFWTSLFGKSVRYAGHGEYTDIVYVGNVEEFKFAAFYINSADEVVSASSCGMDPVVSQFAELLYQGKKLYRKDLEKDPLSWVSRIQPEPVATSEQSQE